MVQFLFSLANSRRSDLQRFTNLMAISLILVSSPGISFSKKQDFSPGDSPTTHLETVLQQPLPVENLERPIFSRPEAKLALRPEQTKPTTANISSSNPEMGITSIVGKSKREAGSSNSNSKNLLIPSPTPTQPQKTLVSEDIIQVPVPSEQTPIEDLGDSTPRLLPNSPQGQIPNSAQVQSMTNSQQTLVAGGANVQDNTTVAYNSVQDEFLVIWRDYNTSPASLRGRRLSSNGVPLAAEFLIINVPGGIVNTPKLLYNSTANSYMLIWSELTGTTVDPYLSCIPCSHTTFLKEANLFVLPLIGDGQPAGSQVLITNKMTIWANSYFAYDLIYNPSINTFVAAWEEPGSVCVYLPNSTCLMHPHHLLVEQIGVDGSQGTPVTLVPAISSDVKLGYSPISGKYMAVFGRNLVASFSAQVFDTSLATSGPILPITTNVRSNDQTNPNLAYLPEDNTYLFSWNNPIAGRPSNIYAYSSVLTEKITAGNASVVKLATESLPVTLIGNAEILHNVGVSQTLMVASGFVNPQLSGSIPRMVGDFLDNQANLISPDFSIDSNDYVYGWQLAGIEQAANPGWMAVWVRNNDIYAGIIQPYQGVFGDSVLNGNCPRDCNLSTSSSTFESLGGPINTNTGGQYYQTTDLSIPTPAGLLSFDRIYSSLATGMYTTALGYGWTHNLDSRLIFPTDPGGLSGSVLFKAHSANRYQFFINSNGTYRPGPGLLASLSCSGSSPETCTLSVKSSETYTFLNGKLQIWEDGKGHSWIYNYDTNSGLLSRVSDGTGNPFLSLTYNQGRIESVSDSSNRTVTYGYETTSGDLMTTTGLDGTWNYEYQDLTNHFLAEIIDPGGQTIERTTYDAQGRATQQYDGNNQLVFQLDYSFKGVTNVTDANGKITTYKYDENNTLVSKIAPLTAATTKTYDANFRPITIANPGQPPTNLSWSSDGADLEQIIDPLGGTTDITYLNHLPHTIIDPRQFQTSYNYTGNLLTGITYEFANPISYTYTYTSQAPLGLIESITDPRGYVTRYEYNADGQKKKVIENYVAGRGQNEANLYNLTTSLTYDEYGRVTTTTDSSNLITKNIYDPAGRLIQIIRNFNNYPVIARNYQDTNGIFNIISEYAYDLHGNQITVTDTLGMITRTFYDANNRPMSVVQNLNGQDINTETIPAFGMGSENIRSDTIYDFAGNVIATINPQQVISRTWYDNADRQKYFVQNLTGQNYTVSTLPDFNPSQPDQNVISETIYDSSGNAIATKDTYGKITRTYYDTLNRPVSIVENLTGQSAETTTPPVRGSSTGQTNLRTDMVYDLNGNTIATIDPLNRITRTYYDALNRPITVVQNLTGRSISNETPPATDSGDQNIRTDTYYDTTGRLIATVDPMGHVTRTYYDAAGRAVTVVRNLTQDINLESIPDRESGAADENIRTDTQYEASGRRISSTDARGLVTTYGYNSVGQLSTTIVNPLEGQPDNFQNKYNLKTAHIYDALGRVLRTTDVLGRVSNSVYDSLGRTTSSTRNYLAEQPQGNFQNQYNVTTSFTYSSEGAQIAITDPLGMVTRTYNDLLGRNVSVVRNLSGSTIAEENIPERGTGETNLRTDNTYDGNGRVTTSVNESGKTTNISYDDLGRRTDVSDPLTHTVHSDYDAGGRLIASTDANGTVTEYEYDAIGNLTAVIENAQSVPDEQVRTEYTYNVIGNRLTIKDGNGHISHFDYDKAGRLISETDPLGHTWLYTYDKNGNRISVVDANQKMTVYAYDLLNRLELIDYPAPDADVTFIYDAASRRTSMNDGFGTTSWHYDALDRPDWITDPFNKTVTYMYNVLGNRATLTYPASPSLPAGKVVTYNYDSANRLNAVLNGQAALTNYQLDAVSRVQSETLANGVTTNYSYDNAGRLLGIVHIKDGQTLASYQYTQYDASGNHLQVIENMSQPELSLTPPLTPTGTQTPTATVETPLGMHDGIKRFSLLSRILNWNRQPADEAALGTETTTTTVTATGTPACTEIPVQDDATGTSTLPPMLTCLPSTEKTLTPKETPSPSSIPTDTMTGTVIATGTPIEMDVFIPQVVPLAVLTSTRTKTATVVLPTATRTKTLTAILPTKTRTKTLTAILPTKTRTKTLTAILPTKTRTRTATAVIPTVTRTKTATIVVPTPTRTKTATIVVPTSTLTKTATVLTPTHTRTSTPTVTLTTAQSSTSTVTMTLTLVPTSTQTPTSTVTITLTLIPTSTQTPTLTQTPTPTETLTPTAVPTLLVDNFSDPILSTEWEWYLPNIGPTYSLNANPGYLQLMVPPNDLYEHWISDDGAPQLRRSDMGSGDWAVETNFDINNSATDGWSQVILMVGFDRYDQLWFNVGSDDILYISRVGEESTSQVAISLPIRLRIEKSGIQFSFLYKPDSGDPVADALQPWTTLETRNVDRPVTYVGLEVRSLDVTTGSLSIDVDQFRLERFGSAPPTPYTESLPDSFEGNSLDASWNWYVPLTGPVYSLTALPGALRMSLPPGGFEHWIYTDDAPQLRRSDLGDQDWAIETELKGISGGETAGYFAALEVGFDQYDQIWFGMDQDGYLGSTRIGVDAPNSRLLTLPLFLRLEKHGQDYLFKYRSSPNGAWTVMPPAYYPGTPQYVGLIARVFSAGNQQLEIDWGSFQLERWPSSPSTLTPTMTTSPTVTLTPTLAFPTGPVTINYGYDKLNRLTEANYSDGRFYHYSYDQVGNRLTASDQYSTTAYVYDDANRLASVNGQPYTYDNNGNLLFNGVTTYAYDSANRLISASNSLGSTTYGYSGLGDRLQETTNGQTTTFTVDLAAGLTQTLDDGTHAYLYGYGRIAQENTTGSEYFLGDALGSVRQLTDESGALILEKTYDPFGVVRTTSGTEQSSYGFTGEQQSGDLVYLRARHYLPFIGRFLTRDTWQGDYNRPGSLNRWNYADGNPVNRVDHSGLCSQTGWNEGSGGFFSSEQCNKLENTFLDVTSGKDYSGLPEMRTWYYRLADKIQKDGRTQAAINLRHFLDGSGSELQLSPEYMNERIWGWGYIHSQVETLADWYIKGHLTLCQPTIPLTVGPDRFATGIVANLNNSDMWFPWNWPDPDEYGSLASFRLEATFLGNINQPWLYFSGALTQADLNLHLTVIDSYNWELNQSVLYPGPIFGARIPDDWAYILAHNNSGRIYGNEFSVRGDIDISYKKDVWFAAPSDLSQPPLGWWRPRQ